MTPGAQVKKDTDLSCHSNTKKTSIHKPAKKTAMTLSTVSERIHNKYKTVCFNTKQRLFYILHFK